MQYQVCYTPDHCDQCKYVDIDRLYFIQPFKFIHHGDKYLDGILSSMAIIGIYICAFEKNDDLAADY